MSNQNDLHRTRWAALSLLLISVLCWTNGATLAQWTIAARLPLHTALETMTVVIFFAVFMVCWNAFNDQRSRNNSLLAVAFLCTGLFGLLHAISFQGMPGFPDALDMHRSFSFWIVSRLISGTALLTIALAPQSYNVSKRQSYFALAAGMGLTIALTITIFRAPSWLPITFDAQTGVTRIKIGAEGLIVALDLFTATLFYRQVVKAQQDSSLPHIDLEKSSLFLATFLSALSEIYFTTTYGLSDFNVIAGHSFQFLSALMIYRGMVAVNIHAPYSTLATAKDALHKSKDELTLHRNRLNGIIETAIDGIITIDEKQTIILANPAAAQMFDATVATMLGTPLEQFIPLRHRTQHAEHVKNFGKTGKTIRRMGNDDFSVSGLRANGEEFPIEASISSLIENQHRYYTVIFRDISERLQAKEKLAQSHAELSRLSNALQTIREEERKHIARELHDDLGQLLAALRMDLSLLQRDTSISERSQQVLRSMDQLVLTSISTLRRIATDLRPRALDEGGLYFALRSLQKEFSQRHRVECALEASEQELRLDDETSTVVFRVIQESLTNVARHAQASAVEIHLKREGHHLHFSIRDNGCGIAEQDMRKAQSFGLVGMRERVRAMNGELQVRSNSGQGTLIEVELPIVKTTEQEI